MRLKLGSLLQLRLVDVGGGGVDIVWPRGVGEPGRAHHYPAPEIAGEPASHERPRGREQRQDAHDVRDEPREDQQHAAKEHQHAVDCLGQRTSRFGGFDLGKLESVRAVSTWFEPDEGFALMAFRGRRAKHHDSDVITAAVLGPETSAPVEDPRLSTTYDAGGWPVRAGLELWLTAENEEEQYPRRAAGEATGARMQTAAGELDLRAEPFRWHSRGREGAGMYLLARRR